MKVRHRYFPKKEEEEEKQDLFQITSYSLQNAPIKEELVCQEGCKVFKKELYGVGPVDNRLGLCRLDPVAR